MDNLDLLKSLSESEFTELVVLPLLECMGYSSIRRLHGKLELGKDIVAVLENPIQGSQNFAFAIKSEKISGNAKSNSSARNCIFQLQQALQEPWIHPDTGSSTFIEKAYLISSHEITQEALLSIQSAPDLKNGRIVILDAVQVIELLSKFCPEILSSVGDQEVRYIQSLARSVTNASSLGSIQAGRPMSLRDIYVGGRLTETNYASATQLSFAATTHEKVEKECDLTSILDKNVQRICVVADVGAGKTSLLQKFVLDCADLPSTAPGQNRRIYPIFLRLATFRPSFRRNEQDAHFESWFEGELESRGGDFAELMNPSRQVVVLLDGFDEIPGEHDTVWSAIENFTERYPANFVVTTRPSRVPRVSRFHLYRLLPLSDGEIQEFLGKWFSSGGQHHQEVLRAIRASEHLLQFCRTPLMLTLLAAIARRTGVYDLPTRRTQFYDKAVHLLLTWDSSRGVVNVFAESAKNHFLQEVAQYHHELGVKQISTKKLLSFAEAAISPVTKHLRASEARASFSAVEARFIDELVYRSNLLKRTDEDQYEFSHLSFQEYFTAFCIHRSANTAPLFKHALDSWWRGVMLFAIGFLEKIPTGFVQSLSRGKSRLTQNTHFLLEYLAEAPYTDKRDAEIIYSMVARQLMRGNATSDELIAECRPNSGLMLAHLSSLRTLRPFESFRLVALACRFGGDAWKFLDQEVFSSLKNYSKWEFQGIELSEFHVAVHAALTARPTESWISVLVAVFDLYCHEVASRALGGRVTNDPSATTLLNALRKSVYDLTAEFEGNSHSVTVRKYLRVKLRELQLSIAALEQRINRE